MVIKTVKLGCANIIEEMVKKSKKPVTVKIRKGFNDENVNAVEVAKRLEQAGASLIAVHGRTREQFYSGVADWDIIRQVKEAVRIPVIGNGDIRSPLDAKRMLDEIVYPVSIVNDKEVVMVENEAGVGFR